MQQQQQIAPPEATSTTTTTRFDHFCFESKDGSCIILNYCAASELVKAQSVEQVIEQLVAFVAQHLQRTKQPQFVVHLFCNGMRLSGMTQHRRFMMQFARMFKVKYPNELHACYVHNAPSFFASIYDLFKPILPRSSRDKIIILPKNSAQNVMPF